MQWDSQSTSPKELQWKESSPLGMGSCPQMQHATLTVLAEVQLGEAPALEGLLEDGSVLPLAEGVQVHGLVLHPPAACGARGEEWGELEPGASHTAVLTQQHPQGEPNQTGRDARDGGTGACGHTSIPTHSPGLSIFLLPPALLPFPGSSPLTHAGRDSRGSQHPQRSAMAGIGKDSEGPATSPRRPPEPPQTSQPPPMGSRPAAAAAERRES